MVYNKLLYIMQAIHNFFKTHLTFLVTDTVDGPTSKEKCIRLRYDNGKRTGGFRKRERDFGPKHSWDNKRQKPSNSVMSQPYDSRGADDWPSDRPKFLRFVSFFPPSFLLLSCKESSSFERLLEKTGVTASFLLVCCYFSGPCFQQFQYDCDQHLYWCDFPDSSFSKKTRIHKMH